MTQMTIAAVAISYADIAFFALVLIGLIIGIIGGTQKAARGIMLTFTIILLSLLLVGFSINGIKGLSFVQSLDDKITEKSSSWGEIFTEEIHVSDEGDFYVIYEVDGEPTQVFLKDAAEEGGISKFKAKFALWLAERFIKPEAEGNAEGQSLGSVLGDFATSLIVALVTFIIFCIVLSVIFVILRKISKRMHESEHRGLRVADRAIGAVMGAVLMVISVLFIMAILHIFRAKIAVVDDYLTNSPVCGFLYTNNPLTSVFGKIFG